MRQIMGAMLLIFLLLALFSACEKKKEETEPTKELSQTEQQQGRIVDSLQVDYGEIMNQLFELRQQIIREPDAIPPRIHLIQTAIDSTRNKLYSVGEGLPDTLLTSEALQRQSAERAALVDAQRWALFALLWAKNPQTPAITEKVTGNVPPFRVVQKAELPEKKMYLMIEINI